MGDAPRTRIRLCGRFAFEIDGEEIDGRLPAGQAHSVLTYLVANRERAPERAELIDVLWPQRPPKDPQSDLRPILSRLRRALAPAAVEGRERLQLVLPEPVWVDVEEAAGMLVQARDAAEAGEWERARGASVRARELLAGGFLPGEDAEWADERRRELEEAELEALELVARCGLAVRGAGLREAEAAGRELIARSPYREDGYRALMEALAAQGNPAEALRVYEELRQVLRDELGTAPAAELQELHGRLLAGEGAATRSPSGAVQPAAGSAAGPGVGAKADGVDGAETKPLRGNGSAPAPLPPLLSPGERGAFVGREAELRTLETAWERARGGARELVFIAGEPGIGKTRLVSEFAVDASADGTVLYAACPQEAVLPYQPIVEALRHYVLTHRLEDELDGLGPGAAELGLLIPEIRAKVGAPEAAADPETRRYMMFDAVAALLAAASRRAPLLLLLDDLHWADAPTLQLLRHLLSAPRRASLLIVGTYREGELATGDPLSGLLAELRRMRAFERIRLRGLDSDDVGALIAFFAGADAPETLRRTIHAGTDGNPFFVEEVMRHLIESRALFEREGRWASSLTVDEIGVPEGVEEVLLSRLGRLSENSRTALVSGAVLGRDFSFEVLRAMVDLVEEALISALEEALAAQLIVEEARVASPRYGFTHALVRQALYRGLTGPRRQALHGRAARAIESAEGVEGDAQVASLALHQRLAESAGDPEKAVEFSLRAGARARELLAWDEAAVHLEGAVAVLERDDAEPELRARLLTGLGDLMVVVGDIGRQIGYLERALALTERLGDRERAAQVHSRLGMAHSLIDSIYAEFLDIPAAFRHFDAAREVLDRDPVRAARGHLEVGVATARTYGLRIPEGIEAAARAMEIADEVGDELLWISAAEAFGWHTIVSGRLSEGLEKVQRAYAMAVERRRTFLAWMAANMSGELTWGLGDPDRAQGFFEEALALPYIERTAHRQQLADGIGRCHALRGEMIAARRLLPDATPSWFTHSLKPLVELWDGRWEQLSSLAAEVLETSRRTGNRWDEWAAEHSAARAMLLRGEHERAVELLRRSLGIVVEGGAPYFEIWVRPDLARALAQTGRAEEARGEIERCREILAGDEEWCGRAGQVAAAEGTVLAVEGRLDESSAAFADALAVLDRRRLHCDAADVTFEWGTALARAGEREAALEQFDAALELLRRHGAGAPRIELVEGRRAALSGA